MKMKNQRSINTFFDKQTVHNQMILDFFNKYILQQKSAKCKPAKRCLNNEFSCLAIRSNSF